MKWRIVIRPNAEADLQAARSWYEVQRAGLGDEFLNEIRKAIHSLENNPTQRRFYYRDFRRLLARRFPYKIFYRIEENRVIVFRILHARRKHEWQLHN